MSYDNHPLTLIKEKSQIYDQALAGNWMLFFAHDPFRSAAHVKANKNSVELDGLNFDLQQHAVETV